MRFALKTAMAGAVIMLMAGCSTLDGDKIADMENKGDEFAGFLRDGYVEMGRKEYVLSEARPSVPRHRETVLSKGAPGAFVGVRGNPRTWPRSLLISS